MRPAGKGMFGVMAKFQGLSLNLNNLLDIHSKKWRPKNGPADSISLSRGSELALLPSSLRSPTGFFRDVLFFTRRRAVLGFIDTEFWKQILVFIFSIFRIEHFTCSSRQFGEIPDILILKTCLKYFVSYPQNSAQSIKFNDVKYY